MAFPPCMITWIKACITSPSFSICINGSLQGYFKGARGSRQGDPMSPYLFVLAMEILARILAEKSRSPLFKFHWRCEKTKIVNLCVADDLMIFSKGDPGTVTHIMQGLEQFRNLSSLTPNPSKSNIFFSGCSRELREDILQIANFAEGSLPVKYLGVPLITTKLKVSDCHVLVERITMRIKSWINKLLSYAGRAQLIQHKNKGGLGFKDLEIWNKAAIAKHVWYLFSGGDCSMWCQWVRSYLLKGRSFWSVKIPSDPSWVWRKILSLRHLIYPLIKFKIGNGENVFLWIWGGILAKCNSNWPSLPWLEIVDFAIRSTSGNSLKVVILKLSFLCTVYHIWMERNSRIFSKVLKPEEVVTNSIIQMVRGRLLLMENAKTSAGDNWFLEKWNLPYKIMQQHHAIADGRRMNGVSISAFPLLSVQLQEAAASVFILWCGGVVAACCTAQEAAGRVYMYRGDGCFKRLAVPTPTGCVRNRCCGGAMLAAGFAICTKSLSITGYGFCTNRLASNHPLLS
ncbi:uncharacterized protein LOC114276326 [Camellia sinensis]|uniref:uncharacterized protein LOC114276326 n=1 Tax=Camellia sinensis TaxID=4442 RepID=UPI001035A5F5|nr:uncharacterized protein LOC114276326 [Camellia sinensis]